MSYDLPSSYYLLFIIFIIMGMYYVVHNNIFLKSKFKDVKAKHEIEFGQLLLKIDELKKENLSLITEGQINYNKIVNLHEEIGMLKKHKGEISELYSQYKEYMSQSTAALLNKFENFATRTLEKNNSQFTESSQQRLDVLLNPLKYKIDTFQRQVNEYYTKELEGRASLDAELKLISIESKKVANSCNNLARTLRGDQKLQGNWGELILKRVLESSGLREGEEYHSQTQVHHVESDDKYTFVDVLISLPENKHVVIDAKTSLKHYEAYQNARKDDERSGHLKYFLNSIKTHIKNLSSKEYQQAKCISSPDFTIMFIPIDSAFILAIQNDNDMQNFALKNNIIISSPSLLIAILRTVSSLWSLSKQNVNAQRIASSAGEMYNKFCGFIEDLSKVGVSLDRAKLAYDNSFNKLYKGNGNLIKKAQDIKNMGIITKSNKNIPKELIDIATLETENMID